MPSVRSTLPAGQLRHAVADAPAEHVAHDASHGVHCPPLKNALAAHEAQSLAVPAVQVAHEPSHAVQTPALLNSFGAHVCARTVNWQE